MQIERPVVYPSLHPSSANPSPSLVPSSTGPVSYIRTAETGRLKVISPPPPNGPSNMFQSTACVAFQQFSCIMWETHDSVEHRKYRRKRKVDSQSIWEGNREAGQCRRTEQIWLWSHSGRFKLVAVDTTNPRKRERTREGKREGFCWVERRRVGESKET